jgi:glyoxylase I family protein
MPIRGWMAHVDLTVADLSRSIPFYQCLLGALGFRALSAGADNRIWLIEYRGGATFEIALQEAAEDRKSHPHDRYTPGLHHLAFHADDRAAVDRTHDLVKGLGNFVLDAPTEYFGKAYSSGYYAVFFADPDGIKLEVCHIPESNP